MTGSLGDVLAAQDPLIEAAWKDHLASPDYEPGERFNDASQLVAILVDLDDRGYRPVVDRALETIEQLLVQEEQSYRYVIVVGFIEDLQNLILNRGGRLEDWEPRIGPSLLQGWKAVADLWAGRMTAEQFNDFVRDGGSQLSIGST